MGATSEELKLILSGDSKEAQSAIREVGTALREAFGEELTGVATIAGVATAAIAAVTGAIVALGVHGSEVADAEEGFKRLGGGAEYANTILQKMRLGVVGTVTDIQLMTDANHLLATGALSSAEDFGMLTAAARVLSREGFGTMQEMITGVSHALETGKTRRLALMGVTVDAKSAEAEYAKSLGVTTTELTTSQKLHADREAILTALIKTVKNAGEQELSFAEKIAQAKTSIANWFDELAKGVALSPHVMGALKAIEDAFHSAFGGSSQTLLETIIEWVNKFADAVAEYGPIFIKWLGEVKDAIEKTISTLKQEWDTIPDWMKNVGKDTVVATASVWALSGAFGNLTGSGIIGDLTLLGSALKTALATTWILGFSGAVSYLLTPITGAILKANLFATSLGTLGEAAALTATSIAAIAIPIATLTALAMAGYQGWKLWGESVERASAETRQHAFDLNTLKLASDLAGKKITDLTEAVKILNDHSAKLRNEHKLTTEQMRELALASDVAHRKITDLAQAESIILTEASKIAHKSITDLGQAMIIVATQAGDGVAKLTEAQKAQLKAIDDINKSEKALSATDVIIIQNLNTKSIAEGEIAKALGVTESQVKSVIEVEKLRVDLEKKAGEESEKIHKQWEADRDVRDKHFVDEMARTVATGQEYDRKLLALNQTALEAITTEWEDALKKLGPPVKGFEAQWQHSVDAINAYFSAKMSSTSMADAVHRAGEITGRGFLSSFEDQIAQIPDLLSRAFTGGGGFAGAARALAAQMGGELGKALSTGKAAQSIADGLASAFKVTTPQGAGSIAKLVSGGLTAGIGTALSIGVDLLGKLFGKSEESAKVNQPREQYIQAAGGLAQLNDQVMKATGSLALVHQLLNAKTEQDYNAAIQAINGAMATFKARLDAAQTSLQTLKDRVARVTEISPALRAALDQAANVKTLDEYEAALKAINGVLDTEAVKQKHVADSLQEIGLSALDAGESYRKAEIDTQATHLADVFRTVKNAGVDVNREMEAMGPKLQDFVRQAQKAGVEVPASMKEVLQVAIDSGVLYDENGKKIEHLDDLHLTFGETATVAMQNIADAVTKLSDVLAKVLTPNFNAAATAAQGLVGSIPDNPFRNWDIPTDFRGGDEFPGHASGGVFTRAHVAQIAEGGRPEIVGDVPFMSRALAGAMDLFFGGGGAPGMAFAGAGGPNVTVDARGSFFPDRNSLQDLADMINRATYDRVRFMQQINLRKVGQ